MSDYCLNKKMGGSGCRQNGETLLYCNDTKLVKHLTQFLFNGLSVSDASLCCMCREETDIYLLILLCPFKLVNKHVLKNVSVPFKVAENAAHMDGGERLYVPA